MFRIDIFKAAIEFSTFQIQLWPYWLIDKGEGHYVRCYPEDSSFEACPYQHFPVSDGCLEQPSVCGLEHQFFNTVSLDSNDSRHERFCSSLCLFRCLGLSQYLPKYIICFSVSTSDSHLLDSSHFKVGRYCYGVEKFLEVINPFVKVLFVKKNFIKIRSMSNRLSFF